MAFFNKDEIAKLYDDAVTEAREWRRNYPEYERLADNGLLDDLEEHLPQVNDGSLASALYKLPKRVIDDKLEGRAEALDVNDIWITEFANIRWKNQILPNANTQATPIRKNKDIVRKAAIYGGQPVITLLADHGKKVGADYIVPQAQDVKLEPGKQSDTDSDIIFWDVYYSNKQIRDLLETAQAETKDKNTTNTWNVKLLKELVAAQTDDEEERPQDEEHDTKTDKAVKKGGVHFVVVFQRGLKSPFCIWYKHRNEFVREWENPDPTGDVPVHYVYFYQDFINPYGVGVCKLAGGTQNILDYFRQVDVRATSLGLRPPKKIKGKESEVDEDSIVWEEDANWFTGNADVEPVAVANGVYNLLPERISMYKTSLNQIIPTGDTSISAGSGDPQYSKTPAGVKFQQNALSIDDEDIKDNFYDAFGLIAKSMINLEFANMEGTEIMKLNDDEKERLIKAGLPVQMLTVDPETGEPTNELNLMWDEARATFDFKFDTESSKETDDEKRLEGLLKVLELKASDPMLEQSLLQSGKKLNTGELLSTIVNLTTDNDKIISDLTPEEQQGLEDQAMMAEEQTLAAEQPQEAPIDQESINIQALMEEYSVDEPTAMAMLEAERQGFSPEEIITKAQSVQAEEAQAYA